MTPSTTAADSRHELHSRLPLPRGPLVGFSIAVLAVPVISTRARDQHRLFKGYDTGAVDLLFKPIEAHILKNKADVFLAWDWGYTSSSRSSQRTKAASTCNPQRDARAFKSPYPRVAAPHEP